MITVLIKENEKGAKKQVITRYGFDVEYLKTMNQQGFGIYAAINSFDATDEEMKKLGVATKRNIPFLKKIKYAFADLDIAKAYDGTSRDEKERRKDVLLDALVAMCVPTKIIETSNGWQPLWKLKPCGIDPETQKKYVSILNGIIAWSRQYGGAGDDVKDVTRVLRIPGFYHMKEEPFLVKVIEEKDVEYSLEELEEKFKDYIPKEKVYELSKQKNDKKNEVFLAIERLDFKELIIRAFASVGRQASFSERGELTLDGRETGTFQGRKDNRDYLASSSHEPFRGNRITAVADILGSTNKEAYAWIMKEFNLNLTVETKKLEAKKIAKEVIRNKPEDLSGEFSKIVKVFTWGTARLDREITPIQTNHFILLVGNSGAGKTAFAFDVACKNAVQGKKVLYLSLEMTRKEIIVRVSRAYAGITKSEWRDRTKISSVKIEAAERRAKELSEDSNLILQGFSGGIIPTVESIFEVIEHIDPDLTIVDNFDLVAKMENISEYEEQTRIAGEFMNKCHDRNRPIIVIHHKNPKSKIQGLGAIRGSGKISDNCNIALSCSRIWSPEATAEENAKFIIMHEKDRDFGGLNVVEIYFKNGTFVDEYNAKVEFMTPEFWSE